MSKLGDLSSISTSNACCSLKFPLPFNDDEFDYIHLSGIGLAVPEHMVC